MKAKRRHTLLANLLGQRYEPDTRSISCIGPNRDLEPGFLKEHTQFIRCREKARFRGTRPRNRENHWAAWPGENVVDRERATRFEDALHLSVEPRFVGNIHRDMLGPNDVKRSIRERQIRCITLAIIDKFGETDSLGKHCSGAAVLVSQVDASDTTAEFPSKAPGCAANTAAYVKYTFRGIDACSSSEFQRCRPTTNMEFIDGRQVFRREPVQVFACFLKCSKDHTSQIRARVVRLDDLVNLSRDCHHSPLCCAA